MTGDFEAARRRALDAVERSRAVLVGEEAGIRRAIRDRGLWRLISVLLLQHDDFQSTVAMALLSGRREGRPEFSEIVAAALELYTTGPVGQAWRESAVERPHELAGEMRALQPEAFGPVFPYLQQVTRDDGKVRENHHALHHFIARSGWAGWAREILSPLGWRCRCRPRRITWQEARERGYDGDFPLGTEKLDAFRRLGGADAGFPRELFVVGAVG